MTDSKRPINLVPADAGPTSPLPEEGPDQQPDLDPAAINILKFTAKVTLFLGLMFLVSPLVLWLALVIPRVQEITGAAAASGHAAKEGLLIGIMLAIISVVASSLATGLKAYAHNEVDERCEREREAVGKLRTPMAEAQRELTEKVEARNRAFGETDAVVTTYREHQRAIVDHFWEGFYARHVNDPSTYGTWSDQKAVAKRFAIKFDELFSGPSVLTPDDIKSLIENDRSGRKSGGFK